MCSEHLDLATIEAEFQQVAKDLQEVLEDIEWRKPDVEEEERLLAKLRVQQKKDPNVDVASQAIVCRVGRAILDDKLAEADRLEGRMKQLTAQLEKLSTPAKPEEKAPKVAEAVPEKAE